MEYVAVIGLLFAPVICLLCAGWFLSGGKMSTKIKSWPCGTGKPASCWLIAAAASLVIFGVLKLLFPITA